MEAKEKKLTPGLIAIIVLAFITFCLGAGFASLPDPLTRSLGILMAVAFMAIGIGLIKLKNWARVMLMVFYTLAFLVDVVLLFLGFYVLLIEIIARMAIEIVVVLYLNKASIKELFKS